MQSLEIWTNTLSDCLINNNNFFILGKQIYNKIVAKIIKNNRIPKIKQTKYNIINRTKMLNRLVFHLTDQYRISLYTPSGITVPEIINS